MRQRLDTMGTRSLELLLARLQDPDQPYVIEQVPPEFMVRESCGCEPVSSAPLRIPMRAAVVPR